MMVLELADEQDLKSQTMQARTFLANTFGNCSHTFRYGGGFTVTFGNYFGMWN